MILLSLTMVGIALIIALCLFLFGWAWFSKPIFGRFMMEQECANKNINMKVALPMEFLSCFLLALASCVIFAPFDWYFGFINGLVIGLTILLPFAISDSIWHLKSSISMFFITLGHKLSLVVLSFMLAGMLNSLIIPMVIGANGGM